MKPDELKLAQLLGKYADHTAGRTIAIIEGGDHGIPVKRAYYLLEKWSDKGYWEYGVSLRAGWWTDKGKAWLREIGVNHAES